MYRDPDSAAETCLSAGSRRRLLQIADAVGCSIGDFFDAGTRCPDIAGAAELIKLWGDIADDAARAKLLAYARDAAVASRGRLSEAD